MLPAGALAQSPASVIAAIDGADCPGIGGTPDISALSDKTTRSRLIIGNEKVMTDLSNRILTARRAVADLRARQQRSGIDSSKQIASTEAGIAQARDRLVTATGFWMLARLYEYEELPVTLDGKGRHPLGRIAAHQQRLDTVAQQSGDPRIVRMSDQFRTCAVQSARDYLDRAQSDGLPQQARTVAAVDQMTRAISIDLGASGNSALRSHPIFATLASQRRAIIARNTPPPRPKPKPVDRCAMATANAQRNLPMVRRFLSAMQRRQLAGTDFLASNAVMRGGGQQVRGRDRIIARFRSFGGSGKIGSPSIGQCGAVSARFSGGRSGTIRMTLDGNKISVITIGS